MKKFLVLLVVCLTAVGIFSQAKDYTTTGSGIRVKKIAFVSVKVYSITHQMKDLPSSKNASEIISAETDKRFILKMMREVDSEKIVNAIKEAYATNGYSNTANPIKLFSPVTGSLKEGDTITISYNSATKTVSCTYNGTTSSVSGSDFMQGTWSIWFGKIDQPDLTKSLMSKIE
jgi:hypothetical protein